MIGVSSICTRRAVRGVSICCAMTAIGPKKELGLGFDTATEVSPLGIAATQDLRGLSLWAITVFPILFSVGMPLIDTWAGHIMLGTYGWAYLNHFARSITTILLRW